MFAFPINGLFLLKPSSVPCLFMACVGVVCYFKISSVCAAGGWKDVLIGPVLFQLLGPYSLPEELLGNNSGF